MFTDTVIGDRGGRRGNDRRLPFISSFGHLLTKIWRRLLQLSQTGIWNATFFFSLSLCSCCFNSWLPLLLFSLNMLHDCNKRKKINLFLTGVGHLLSDREVSKQNTRSSEMSTVTFIFLPFPFCCPDNPWTHAPVCSPGQEPAEYILVLSFFKGWEACQSVFSLSSVAVELHQDVCLLWS